MFLIDNLVKKKLLLKQGNLVDRLNDKIKNDEIKIIYESDLRYNDSKIICEPDLNYNDSLFTGSHFIVDEVYFGANKYAFKQFHKTDVNSFYIDSDEIIANCALALNIGHHLFPDNFPELNAVVVSEEHGWKGLLVELFERPSKYLPLSEVSIKQKTLDKMSVITQKMHENAIWCDIKEENIYIDINDSSNFVLLDPMYNPNPKAFLNDWAMINTYQMKYVDNTSVLPQKATFKQMLNTYRTILDI